MIKRICLTLLLVAAAGLASDWSGKWSGTFKTVKGGPGAPPSDDHFLVIKQDGGNISGTAGPKESAQWEIQNARLEGDRLAFETAPPGGIFVLGYELTIREGVITGRVASKKGPPLEGTLELKRSN